MVQSTRPIKDRRGKGINDDRETNRADARGSAEKEPGNHFWGGRSAHASVGFWVCSVLWSRTSFYDSDHIAANFQGPESTPRSEEHTSELQSRQYLVCRLLLEKKK